MSDDANTPGDGFKALGMTPQEFENMLFPNREIARQFLRGEQYKDIVSTIRANRPLSQTQTQRLEDCLGNNLLGTCYLLLIYGLPESRYEKTGLALFSLTIESLLKKGKNPETIRETLIASMDRLISILSEMGGKESVTKQLAQKKDALTQLNTAMNTVMDTLGMPPPKPEI